MQSFVFSAVVYLNDYVVELLVYLTFSCSPSSRNLFIQTLAHFTQARTPISVDFRKHSKIKKRRVILSENTSQVRSFLQSGSCEKGKKAPRTILIKRFALKLQAVSSRLKFRQHALFGEFKFRRRRFPHSSARTIFSPTAPHSLSHHLELLCSTQIPACYLLKSRPRLPQGLRLLTHS